MVDKFELHVDDIYVVLVNLLLVLQYLLACNEFAKL